MISYLPAIVIFIYLAAVLYTGIFAFRRKSSGSASEDFFLANRSIGSIVFFLSLFATNMTAVAILGSSGAAYRQGIGIFGMMASISGIVIPLTLFFVGTRLWALGKRLGHMTQVQFFRDRWECSSIGTVIFLLTAVMLMPYLIVSIIGGGTILEVLTSGKIAFPVGGAIVALVVMGNVFFGGMRGAVWVNVFQTLLFLSFGLLAVLAIGHHINFTETVHAMAGDPKMRFALTRERIPFLLFLSYMFIPLSSIMFPHMSIMCLTAKRVTAFKKTVVLYPLCIMAIWLPCVFLGAIAVSQPIIAQLIHGDTNAVLLEMLKLHVNPALAGILAAGIISAVMGSDCHQILGLSTMFTRDVFDYYGGRRRFGDRGSVTFGRIFIVAANAVAYLIALRKPAIFELAVTYAFSGFAALFPIMAAALFWRRSTRYGALASTLWVALCLAAVGYCEIHFAPAPQPGPPRAVAIWQIAGQSILGPLTSRQTEHLGIHARGPDGPRFGLGHDGCLTADEAPIERDHRQVFPAAGEHRCADVGSGRHRNGMNIIRRYALKPSGLIVVVVIVALTMSLFAEDWPRWRGPARGWDQPRDELSRVMACRGSQAALVCFRRPRLFQPRRGCGPHLCHGHRRQQGNALVLRRRQRQGLLVPVLPWGDGRERIRAVGRRPGSMAIGSTLSAAAGNWSAGNWPMASRFGASTFSRRPRATTWAGARPRRRWSPSVSSTSRLVSALMLASPPRWTRRAARSPGLPRRAGRPATRAPDTHSRSSRTSTGPSN